MQRVGGGALIRGFKVAFTYSTHENTATTPLSLELLCKLLCLEGGWGRGRVFSDFVHTSYATTDWCYQFSVSS